MQEFFLIKEKFIKKTTYYFVFFQKILIFHVFKSQHLKSLTIKETFSENLMS